jgi:hypothetical protein
MNRLEIRRALCAVNDLVFDHVALQKVSMKIGREHDG